MNDVWRRKLGLGEWRASDADLIKRLLRLMASSGADYTIFFRQLAVVAEQSQSDHGDDQLIAPLSDAFYGAVAEQELATWVREWLGRLDSDANDRVAACSSMRAVSPKYVPREWMLIEAYSAAAEGDDSVAQTLHDLFKTPYDEVPEHESR